MSLSASSPCSKDKRKSHMCPSIYVFLTLESNGSVSKSFVFVLLQYYAESHALIYIVDSSDRDRIPDSKEAFGMHFYFYFTFVMHSVLEICYSCW
jgi:hypothetical protein